MAEIEDFLRQIVRSEVREALADIGTDDLFSQDVQDSMVREASRLAEVRAEQGLEAIIRERQQQLSKQLENEVGIRMRAQADYLVKDRLKHHLMVAAQQETGAVCARMEGRLKEAMLKVARDEYGKRAASEDCLDNWGQSKDATPR